MYFGWELRGALLLSGQYDYGEDQYCMNSDNGEMLQAKLCNCKPHKMNFTL